VEIGSLGVLGGIWECLDFDGGYCQALYGLYDLIALHRHGIVMDEKGILEFTWISIGAKTSDGINDKHFSRTSCRANSSICSKNQLPIPKLPNSMYAHIRRPMIL